MTFLILIQLKKCKIIVSFYTCHITVYYSYFKIIYYSEYKFETFLTDLKCSGKLSTNFSTIIIINLSDMYRLKDTQPHRASRTLIFYIFLCDYNLTWPIEQSVVMVCYYIEYNVKNKLYSDKNVYLS